MRLENMTTEQIDEMTHGTAKVALKGAERAIRCAIECMDANSGQTNWATAANFTHAAKNLIVAQRFLKSGCFDDKALKQLDAVGFVQ